MKWLLPGLCVIEILTGVVHLLWGYRVFGWPQGLAEKDGEAFAKKCRFYRTSGWWQIGLAVLFLVVWLLLMAMESS